VAWLDKLPTNPAEQGIAVQPLAIQRSAGGPVDVFGEDDTVYGLRESDGHPLWTWTGGQPIYGLWNWRGTVVVLSGQVSSHAELAEIDSSTGTVRWTLALPRTGLLGSQALTADGGLAMVVPDGTLEVADLATGRLRWAHPLAGALPSGPQPTPQAVNANVSPGPAAVGPVVVEASGGQVFGYDSRTGAVRWTVSGLLEEPYLTAADGLVLVSSGGGSGTGISTAVTALSPATGRVAWRFDPGTTVMVEGAGPAGILLTSYTPDRLYLIDPATGRERWQATTFIEPSGPATQVALVTATGIILAEGQRGPNPNQRQRYVDRSAATGAVRWSVPFSGWAPPAVPVLALGPLAATVTDPNSLGKATLATMRQATGKPGWRVTLPTTLWVPPALTPSGVLAQSTDPSYGCPAVGGVASAPVSPAAAP